MGKIIVGRYLPGNSLIHRLDPRAKFIATFIFVAIIFLANNWATYLALGLFVLWAVYLSKVSLTFFIKGVRPMLFLILFTVALQIFFTPGGNPFWQWGILSLSKLSIINGIFILLRFTLIIFISTLLTITTTPLQMSDAIEYLLRPLRKIHFPVDEVALMLSIALQFIPLLSDETTKIMNAQRARGVDFGEGNIIKQIKAIVPILIPLFVSSFNIAYDLSIAMEARGYNGSAGRTKYRQLHWQKPDTLVLTSFGLLTIILLILRSY
ncbi:energy-coupling factor transporter transmembrane component T family protein [Bombilactobacillus thymidiniphilus]|uniref:Energy-coupling factor transporter transmembrane protein EcfT n=1 Tax=Bombilactobacillus thymidiniphilus TaxID=2923363 RepID=A0ABY4PEN0_9LACO|nr:energy-coupling factor transporter transmembrane component T [Bombilactobacillus thymidiniphilus]UQS83971.1 energy-coupling factor transporter transmembrane protein EcfT [Bombilactobacillus thymidiniphilus]